jgi:hypothetical protein
VQKVLYELRNRFPIRVQKLNKLKAKRPQKWVFILKKLEFLRAKESHRSERRVPQRFKHRQRESLSVTGLRV